MNRFFCAVVAAVSVGMGGTAWAQIASPAPVFAPKYLESVPLRYTDAATLAKSLNAQKLPPGMVRVRVDADNPKAVQLLGTADAIATLKAAIVLIDVAPKKATFRVFLEKAQFGTAETPFFTTVYRQPITLTHNVPAQITVPDKRGGTLVARLTARLPHGTDTPPTLFVTFGWQTAKGGSVGLERAVPLPTGKQGARVIGITFADEPDFIGTVGVGHVPKQWRGTPTAYFVRLQAVPDVKTTK